MTEDDRFARHNVLAGLGPAGQRRLREARVLVVGIGGLGCPAALYLAAAGVGRLSLCDVARVDAPDLQRQVLFGQADLGQPKADAAARRLRAYPDVAIDARERRFDPEMVARHDLVLDCTDEPGTRAFVHAACVQARVPLVWGAVEAWDGQVAAVLPGHPCLDCLFPDGRDAPSCQDVGVFGPLAGQVGCVMAGLAIQVLLGAACGGTLLVADGRTGAVETVSYPRRADCPTCAGAAK